MLRKIWGYPQNPNSSGPVHTDKDHEKAEISNFHKSQQKQHVVLPLIQLK